VYEYRAKLIRVVDGDTVWLDVDLGCDIHVAMSCRLYGVNAPEMSTAEGEDAKAYVAGWFLENEDVILHTLKDKKEKYGRYLARIYPDVEGAASLNDQLIDTKHAVEYLP
jgi:micrococcal nuclease